MAVRKKKKPARKQAAAAAANPSRQIAALRAEVTALRTKLERESRAGQINVRLLNEAKKARAQLAQQIAALRTQGSKLATQLRSTLGDSKRRDQARKEAMARVADLRKELARRTDELRKELASRTDELRRKSDELRQLAQQSAQRAVEIIRSEAKAAPPEPAPEPDFGVTPDKEEPRG
jgi:chromosome segregation ATPase